MDRFMPEKRSLSVDPEQRPVVGRFESFRKTLMGFTKARQPTVGLRAAQGLPHGFVCGACGITDLHRAHTA
jgi:hypothetical protein